MGELEFKFPVIVINFKVDINYFRSMDERVQISIYPKFALWIPFPTKWIFFERHRTVD